MESWYGLVLAVGVVFGLFGAFVAAQKLRPIAEGMALGFAFGPFGVLIEALLPPGADRPSSPVGPSLDPDQVARVKAEILAALAESDPDWWSLPWPDRLDAFRDAERLVGRLMLRADRAMTKTRFAHLAAEARRTLLGK